MRLSACLCEKVITIILYPIQLTIYDSHERFYRITSTTTSECLSGCDKTCGMYIITFDLYSTQIEPLKPLLTAVPSGRQFICCMYRE